MGMGMDGDGVFGRDGMVWYRLSGVSVCVCVCACVAGR